MSRSKGFLHVPCCCLCMHAGTPFHSCSRTIFSMYAHCLPHCLRLRACHTVYDSGHTAGLRAYDPPHTILRGGHVSSSEGGAHHPPRGAHTILRGGRTPLTILRGGRTPSSEGYPRGARTLLKNARHPGAEEPEGGGDDRRLMVSAPMAAMVLVWMMAAATATAGTDRRRQRW